MKNYSERLRNLEKKIHSGECPTIIIDVLGDGMVEVYTEKDGEKILMTEAEYETWTNRYKKSSEPIDISVNIGEWED